MKNGRQTWIINGFETVFSCKLSLIVGDNVQLKTLFLIVFSFFIAADPLLIHAGFTKPEKKSLNV